MNLAHPCKRISAKALKIGVIKVCNEPNLYRQWNYATKDKNSVRVIFKKCTLTN